MGTRVAMVALTDGPPRILLAGHLDGDQPVLVYRVDDLTAAMAELEGSRLDAGPHAGDPAGPGLLVHALRAVSGWRSTS